MVKIQLEGGLTMRAKLLPVIIFCLLFGCASGLAEELSQVRLLRASLVEGDVTYQRPDLDRWIDLNVNTPLLEGDKVWAGNDGRAEVEFEDGTFIRLNSNSIVEISHLGSQSGSGQIEMQFVRGIGSFEIQQSEMIFVIDTPLFSMRIKEAASFRVDLEENGSGRMVVFEGSIEVAGEKAHLYVRKGEIIRFLSEDPERYFLSADYQQDDWDRWNEERTTYIAKRQQDRRHDGDAGWTMTDMENSGNWYTDSEYGNVWSPGLGADWAPYRNGRWVWYGDLGWTWVSYESWGWVPYHYGRWTYSTSLGWCWVPGPRSEPWCPGAVSWIEGPNWVGWVPLGPSEPWYAYTSANVFISKNYRYRHGRTCLPRDSFLNGTPAGNFVPPAGSFPRRKSHFGSTPLRTNSREQAASGYQFFAISGVQQCRPGVTANDAGADTEPAGHNFRDLRRVTPDKRSTCIPSQRRSNITQAGPSPTHFLNHKFGGWNYGRANLHEWGSHLYYTRKFFRHRGSRRAAA